VAPLGERIAGAERRAGLAEQEAKEARASAERALRGLGNLRLEKRFVLDFRQGANFAFDSAVLAPEAQQAIDGLIADLEGTEQLMFFIAGHTDATGSEDYNYELGRKRAESVARYLVAKKGIDPFRISTVSYGESAPVAENDTPEGRRQNRRVEILIYRETIAAPAEGSEKDGP
jgi:outer membrane protein OmpA-like peptidoglycan-associated protein